MPEQAHVNLIFPHIRDGGPEAQKWTTTFTIVNPASSTANAVLRLRANDGSPLLLDFGSGPGSRVSFTVPAKGVRSFRTRGTSISTVSGWAGVYSDVPLLSNVTVRLSQGGIARMEYSVLPTLPSINFLSAANPNVTLDLVNLYTDSSVSVKVIVRNAQGDDVESKDVSIGAAGRRSFVLSELFPAMPKEFLGSVFLTSFERDVVPIDFVASTLNGDGSGLISNFPGGKPAYPASQWDRIWLVFSRVLNGAREFIGPEDVELRISYERNINAFAADGKLIQINIAIAELISDSDSELAFVVAHEMGHIYQRRTGLRDFDVENAEFDADIWGVLFAMAGGYDPYAAAGTLGKLAMATGKAGLMQQFEDFVGADAHSSINTRMSNIYDAMVRACSEIPDTCRQYKLIFHPSLPSIAPLNLPGQRVERN
jgi:hypothetical protein